MIWIALAIVSLGTTAGLAVHAKQSLIDDARSGTKGYF